MSDLDALRAAAIADPEVPKVIRAALVDGAALESIRLDSRGRWSHRDEPFVNRRIARLFARSLQRTTDGTWLLRIGRFTYPVTVEGSGWFVRRIRREADGTATAVLTDGRTQPIDWSTLETDGSDYVGIRIDGGARRARLVEAAYADIADALVGGPGAWAVRWADRDHPASELAPPERTDADVGPGRR
jgi:hypothetical protein